MHGAYPCSSCLSLCVFPVLDRKQEPFLPIAPPFLPFLHTKTTLTERTQCNKHDKHEGQDQDLEHGQGIVFQLNWIMRLTIATNHNPQPSKSSIFRHQFLSFISILSILFFHAVRSFTISTSIFILVQAISAFLWAGFTPPLDEGGENRGSSASINRIQLLMTYLSFLPFVHFFRGICW